MIKWRRRPRFTPPVWALPAPPCGIGTKLGAFSTSRRKGNVFGEMPARNSRTATSRASIKPETKLPSWYVQTTRCFLLGSAGILLLTASAKLFSNFTDPRLQSPDPFLVFLTGRTLLLLTSFTEFFVAALILKNFFSNCTAGLKAVAWLCAVFVLYRTGFSLAPDQPHSCKCFGVGSFLGIMEGRADLWSVILLSFLVLGSGILLGLSRWIGHRALHSIAVLGLTLSIASGDALALHAEAFQPLYEATGEIAEMIYRGPGNGEATNRYPFSIAVDATGRWAMSIASEIAKWDAHMREEIAFDGTNIFSVLYGDKRLNRKLQPEPNLPLDKNEHPGRTFHGPYPIENGTPACLIWLAFLGGTLNTKVGAIPDLIAGDPRRDPAAWVIHPSLSFQSQGNFTFLRSARFQLNPPESIPSNLDDFPEFNEPTETEEVAAALRSLNQFRTTPSKERLRSEFSLVGFQTHDGFSLPAEFTARRLGPLGTGFGDVAVVRWVGKVFQADSSPTARELLPQILGKIHVEDSRLRHRTKTTYLNSTFYTLGPDGWIRSKHDPRFQGQHRPPELPRASSRSREIMFLVVSIGLAVLVGIPGVSMLKRAWAISRFGQHQGPGKHSIQDLQESNINT